MISKDSIPDSCNTYPNALEAAKELAQGRLAIMCQLHASLCRSHQALLALDLAGIRQETGELEALSRNLRAEIRRGGRWSAGPPRLAEELRQSENAVVGALRLQSALLARAQQKLQVLKNMLAGTAANYSDSLARSSRLQPASAWKRAGSQPGGSARVVEA